MGRYSGMMKQVLMFGMFVSMVAAACSDPCQELGEKICNCRPTELDRQNCLQRVSDESGQYDLSSDEENMCSALKKTCTCERLENQDLAACGLARPAVDTLENGQVVPRGWEHWLWNK
mgnify:CR=1 FL=1